MTGYADLSDTAARLIGLLERIDEIQQGRPIASALPDPTVFTP